MKRDLEGKQQKQELTSKGRKDCKRNGNTELEVGYGKASKEREDYTREGEHEGKGT